MHEPRSRPQAVAPGGRAFLRYFLLSLVFGAGILCVVGSAFLSGGGYDPHALTTSDRVAVYKSGIAEEKNEIRTYTRKLAKATNPDHRAHLQRAIVAHQAKLERLQANLAQIESQMSTGSCFAGDMQVLTAEGARPIGALKAGDRVLSVDAAGNQVVSEVLETYADRSHHYYHINRAIKATALHRFFTASGWKRARELEVGDRIKLAGGRFEEVVSIDWVVGEVEVFNLHIDQNHNFFVSADGESGFLVHNTGGGGGGGGGGGAGK